MADVREGDVLIGLASSGLHANGFSLVRSALLGRFGLDEVPAGLDRALGDELLEPCAIYATDVVAFARAGLLRSAAHITGGGLPENLPRALPEGLGARVERGSWSEHPVFELVRSATSVTADDMFATFNMGIGMVLVVDPSNVDEVIARSRHEAFRIGHVALGAGAQIA